MNIDEVIRAHVAWKSKLAAYLAKPDGSIKIADTVSDRKCELGRWIYGEGSKIRQPSRVRATEEGSCPVSHRRSRHRPQGRSRRILVQGPRAGADSEFVTASRAVSNTLFRIKPKNRVQINAACSHRYSHDPRAITLLIVAIAL